MLQSCLVIGCFIYYGAMEFPKHYLFDFSSQWTNTESEAGNTLENNAHLDVGNAHPRWHDYFSCFAYFFFSEISIINNQSK